MSIGPALASVDTTELKRLERHLIRFKDAAFPYAVRETMNRQAFESQADWRHLAGATMTLRSPFTKASIQVERAQGLSVNAMKSEVGSVASYMDEQEEGATEPKKHKHGVALPAAAPGKRKNRGRVSKASRPGAIKLLPTISGHRSRKVAASFAMTKKRGTPQFAYLELKKGRRGIYKLSFRGNGSTSLRKVIDLSKPRVVIPRNPTMHRAVQRVVSLSDGYYREALITQLRRHHVLGY